MQSAMYVLEATSYSEIIKYHLVESISLAFLAPI